LISIGRAVLSCGLLLVATAHAAPSRAALDLVRSITYPSRVGVDRGDALWVWDARDQSVSRITAAGAQLTVDVGSDISALDADSERGVVALNAAMDAVQVIGWNGAVTSKFTLPYTAGAVAWLSGDTIAVAPRTAPWRVEVWDTAQKKRVRGFGPVPEIRTPTAGAVPVRSTLLRYDAARRQLFAFDAFEGELVVFDEAGKAVRNARIAHPNLESNRQFLRTMDVQAMKNGQSSMPSFTNYARLSVGPDGTVWLGEESDDDRSMTIARIAPDGRVQRSVFKVPECNSVRFELWQGQLVFFRDPKSPLKQCVTVKEAPR
jgi:hypothetical protein